MTPMSLFLNLALSPTIPVDRTNSVHTHTYAVYIQYISEVGTISVIAYLWRIVIASDSYCFRLSRILPILKVIALSLQVSVIASFHYCFEQLTQVLLLLGK